MRIRYPHYGTIYNKGHYTHTTENPGHVQQPSRQSSVHMGMASILSKLSANIKYKFEHLNHQSLTASFPSVKRFVSLWCDFRASKTIVFDNAL